MAIVTRDVPLGHPFYLHRSESPNLLLAQSVLEGPKYHTWYREVILTLDSKDKVCFIDDLYGFPKLKKGEKLFNAWKQENSMVLAWLHKSVSPTNRQSILWTDSARELWLHLKQRYSHGDAYRLLQFLEQFHTKKQGRLMPILLG